MPRLIQPTVSMGFRLALLLAGAAWIVSQWQVFGATAATLSCAAGPGGWEISRWDAETSKPFSLFSYSAAEETNNAPAEATRQWGIFVYHWLIVTLLAAFYGLLAWFYRAPAEQSATAQS